MSEKRASLEVIAPTVDEAVARGLADLGLSENEVQVDVLDAGSRGLFGLGYRQARVRLTIRAALVEAAMPVEPAAPEPPAPAPVQASAPAPAPVFAVAPAAAPDTTPVAEPVLAKAQPAAEIVEAAAEEPEFGLPESGQEELDDALRVARDTVEELLGKMKIRASVSVHQGEPEDARDRAAIWVDVRGDDLSILIGPKAETLNALQYIAGLIVSKEIGRSVPLIVDVEGFRARRSQQIRQLARRMADQAVRTGRRQVWEPMPASERRIVHIELRNNPNVTTESVGEEPRRKVTINPK
jgi:spoIIIJ-associated protein